MHEYWGLLQHDRTSMQACNPKDAIPSNEENAVKHPLVHPSPASRALLSHPPGPPNGSEPCSAGNLDTTLPMLDRAAINGQQHDTYSKKWTTPHARAAPAALGPWPNSFRKLQHLPDSEGLLEKVLSTISPSMHWQASQTL